MNFKKILYFIFILNLILIPKVSLADDYLEYDNLHYYDNIEVSLNISEVPTVNARHCIIFDRNSKNVLFGKNEKEQCKMASTTKIMTAIIVIENCDDLHKVVSISKKAANTGGSRLGLSTNDKVSVEHLLYGLMMVSGNDAAVALAEFISGNINNFAEKMNTKAQQLELKSTHFVSPHGLDQDQHYTTAYDLAKLTDYSLENSTFAKIVNTQYYTISINDHTKSLKNTNELLGYINGVYGVKTGFTNGANRCLVTACKRNNFDIICIVLGCDTKKDRTLDSIKLINYVFNNFSLINIKDIILTNFQEWDSQNKQIYNIIKGESSNLELYLDKNQIPYELMAINKKYLDKISTPIVISTNYQAPLKKDSVIGTLKLIIDNSTYFEVSLLNKNTINRKNVFNYLNIFIKNYFNYFL